MGQKTVLFQLVWFLTLTAFSILILYPAGQHTFLLLFPLIPIQTILLAGGSLFIKRRYYPICLSAIIITTFIILKTKILCNFTTGIPTDIINKVSGYVIYDSSFTENGNNFMTVLITKAYSTYGQEVSAGGVISVICDERSIITSGVKVALEGKFSESLFVSNRCLVMNRSLLNSLRERVIVTLEKRIAGTNPTQAGILSMMLLTGRVEDSHARIKTLAQRCGCTHILALSGMHLNTLTLFLKPIKKKGVNYILSVILSLLFVFIAGPRPSLVRALLMLIFRFLPNTERLAVCFIVQLIIFPFSMFNIGCIYSYLAIFALTYLGPLFKSRINILTTFADSASVILLIAPVELITSEAWHPIAIFLGPIAGVLIAFSMFSGILLALSNHLPFLERVNEFTYSSIEKLLATFSGSRNCGWKEYCLYAIICLILILSIPIEQRTRRHRFKKNSKLNIMKL